MSAIVKDAGSMPYTMTTQLYFHFKSATNSVANLRIRAGNWKGDPKKLKWTFTLGVFDFTGILEGLKNPQYQKLTQPGVQVMSAGGVANIQLPGDPSSNGDGVEFDIIITPASSSGVELAMNFYIWTDLGVAAGNDNGGFSFDLNAYDWANNPTTFCDVRISNDDGSEYNGTIDKDANNQLIHLDWTATDGN